MARSGSTPPQLLDTEVAHFWQALTEGYAAHRRDDLPWRHVRPDGTINPYHVLLSEIMLQQTQVQRVLPLFNTFLIQFPSIDQLASAPLADVLVAWQGLGYNRRARFLWQSAQMLSKLVSFPRSVDSLVTLPGIGPNTAAAILVYSFNQPEIFIETNIRSVLMHHFATPDQLVEDRFLKAVLTHLIEDFPESMFCESFPGLTGISYRDFYWAMMDYGSVLKKSIKNNMQSKQYVKQTTFDGSRRQLRGKILRLLASGPCNLEEIHRLIDDDRLDSVLSDLMNEELISIQYAQYQLG